MEDDFCQVCEWGLRSLNPVVCTEHPCEECHQVPVKDGKRRYTCGCGITQFDGEGNFILTLY